MVRSGTPTSTPADGKTVSHEAIYRFIYALPKGDLAKHGVLLRSKRTRRRRPRPAGERGAPIVGMTSIDAREDVADRRVPGHWEGDLIIGAHGKTAATLVERTTRFTVILALPEGKDSAGLADVLIENANELPAMMRKTLTWDQGPEMAKHAALTLATDMPVYFAHAHSPWQRGTTENTNGLIREYLPKGTVITDHQPYLTAIAEELNERPRATLGFLTPEKPSNASSLLPCLDTAVSTPVPSRRPLCSRLKGNARNEKKTLTRRFVDYHSSNDCGAHRRSVWPSQCKHRHRLRRGGRNRDPGSTVYAARHRRPLGEQPLEVRWRRRHRRKRHAHADGCRSSRRASRYQPRGVLGQQRRHRRAAHRHGRTDP
jgi:IS30 family transposase